MIAAECPSVLESPRDAVQWYIDGVMDGSIVAARLVKRAVERHVHDLQHGESRGLHFSEDDAIHAIEFFSLLRHWKGAWAGQVFELSPWQAFLTWCIFGWKREDGTRRFRTVYIEVPRKNGKTSWLAGVGLYLLTADGEAGAEIYSFATKKDQARIVLADAENYLKKSPSLKSRLQVAGGKYINNISFAAANAKWEILGSDSTTQDGFNPSGGLGDEIHEHPDSGMWDVIESGMGARLQPLMLGITTAGADIGSYCGQLHEYAEQLLTDFDKDNAQAKNDAIFAFVSAAEKDSDWTDEKTWQIANPNYGVSVREEYLRDMATKAKRLPSALNNFLRKHLDIWTEQVERWISPDAWDECRDDDFDYSSLAGRLCYGGLDLSSKLDLTAFILLFPPTEDDPKYRFKLRLWIPEATARQRQDKERIDYDRFIEQGIVVATPGDVVDYGFVEKQVAEDAETFGLQAVAFDPWNAASSAQRLQDDHGIQMKEFRQGMISMNEPCKELERIIAAKELGHDGNAAMRWMIGNAQVKRDESGNMRPVKPDKNAGRKRVDGVMALVMALGLAILKQEGGEFDIRIV